MCYNAPVSFGSYFFGLVIATTIYLRNPATAFFRPYDYWNLLTILSYITVQLGEGLLHLEHLWGRWIILYSIALQPVVNSFGAAYWGKSPIFYIPFVIGLLFIPFLSIKGDITRGPNGYLDWIFKFPGKTFTIIYAIYYFTFMFLPLTQMKPITRFYPLIIYLAITLLISLYNYGRSGEWSSMWCFMAIGYSVLCYYSNQK